MRPCVLSTTSCARIKKIYFKSDKISKEIASYVVLDWVIIQSYDCSSGILHQCFIPDAIGINFLYIYQISKQQIGRRS